MTPAYERDPEQFKVVPKDKWFESPALPAEAWGLRHDWLDADSLEKYEKCYYEDAK